jgi:hypothetical protein
MTQIKITAVETMPQLDPYHRDTGQETWTALFVDPTDGEAYIRQEYDDNATPEDVWNGRRLREKLHTRPDESAARAYLTGADGQALLERVVAGHEIEFDGSNMAGSLNEDAQAALGELVSDLENLPACEWSMWQVDDYLNDAIRGSVQPMTSDDELKRQADEIEAEANTEQVIIIGNVLEYITEYRDRIQGEWLDENYLTPDEIAERTGDAASGWRNKAAAGKIAGAIKKGKQWLIPLSAIHE